MNEKKDIHMVGCAHLDVCWFWPWSEGLAEVKSTFKAALDRLDEFPEFVFTCSSQSYYEWLEQSFPDIFERIKHYVDEGRWIIVGGWNVQPDVNIPGGEAFARQSLYSQRYYLDKFGKLCDVGYNVDSFGHNIMLPQLLRLGGMNSYVFSRPRKNENDEIPDVFLWESPDGSTVKASRLLHYGGPTQGGVICPERLVGKIETERDTNDFLPRMYFYGVANHGGGPTISLLKEIERVRKEDEHVFYSNPSKFFASLKEEDLPKWTNECQIHAPGCYSALHEVKQTNRRAEQKLIDAEALGAVAHMKIGREQNPEHFKDAWKKVCFNHFHDAICGCSSRFVYDDVFAAYGYAMEIARQEANEALQQLTYRIDTQGDDDLPNSKDNDNRLWTYADKGQPLVVYNPLPYEIETEVRAAGGIARVTDSKGEEVLMQPVRSDVTSTDVLWHFHSATAFVAKLPAFGYETFWLHKGEVPQEANADGSVRLADSKSDSVVANATANKRTLENEYIRAEFDGKGRMTKLIDKGTGKNFVAQGTGRFVVIDNHDGDTWCHKITKFDKVVGEFKAKKFQILENGPVRARIRITYTYKDSYIEADYVLHSFDKTVDVNVKINWREHYKMLKYEWTAATDNCNYQAQVPYGIIVRDADGLEKPMNRWVTVSDENMGLAIANDSVNGVDVLKNRIRMSLLRSPKYADHNGVFDKKGNRDAYGDYMEQGEHLMKFRLIPTYGNGDKRRLSYIGREADKLNTETMQVYETYHKGELSQSMEGVCILQQEITIDAMKQAEDGGAYIIRCHETTGRESEAEIKLPLIDRTIKALFGPYEIKTFKVPYDGGEISEVNFIEMDN